MKLRRVSEEDCDQGTCPAVYVSDQGTAVAQGPAVRVAEGLTLGPGELAVELPTAVLFDAVIALAGECKDTDALRRLKEAL
jgi:hypothetical protein